MTSKIVGDFVTLQRGITYKGNLVGKPGPALLGLGAICPGGGFKEGGFKTYGGDCPQKLMLYPGDLFVSLKGATKDGEMIGSIARVPKSVKSGRLTQDTVGLCFNEDAHHVRNFIYWVLRTPQYRDYCAGRAMGSAVVALSREDFLSFPVPELTPERECVVALLEAVEEKIELNRKTNDTLEAMAKALFKSWFVDFDPVRARAEGRPTGLPDDISDLFPNSFEDSELDNVPANWVMAPLQDEATVLTRGISPAYCDADGVRVINQKCIREWKVDLSKARLHDANKKSIGGKYVARYDALVNSTGVGTLGRVSMMPAVNGEVTVDSHVTIVRGKSSSHSLYLAYTLMNREAEVESMGEGSTGQTELSRARLGGMPILLPPSQVLQAFFDQAAPIEDRREQLSQESLTLANLRDTLLPKLISGELRIPDAERFMAEAGI